MTDVVSLEVTDGVGTIRLDRPPMNALDTEMARGIIAACAEATERPDVGAVVVHGGAKVFAAGADIKEMAALSYADMHRHASLLQDFTRALAAVPKPTVAAITGYALGGGCEVALACDLRVAGRRARLGQPEILLGIIPGAGGTQRLARLVGPAKAKDLIFSGRFVTAEEALAIGLVDEVVDSEEPDAVLAAATARASAYARGPRLALAAAKEAIDRGLDVDLRTGLDLERSLFWSLFATRDQEIGMQSFIENGPGKATFTGE